MSEMNWRSPFTKFRPPLSIVAFVLVALVSLPLGRLQAVRETDADPDDRPARVLPPLAAPAGPVVSSDAGALATDLSGIPMLAAVSAP